MGITVEDRLDIAELLALHGHLCDDGELDRFDEVFAADVVYDLSEFGRPDLVGPEALAAAGRALGDGNPVGHHVTNIVLTEAAGGTVHARSKGIGVMADGSCGSVIYDDTVVRGEAGWRISRRRVTAHRRPLGQKAGQGMAGHSPEGSG